MMINIYIFLIFSYEKKRKERDNKDVNASYK